MASNSKESDSLINVELSKTSFLYACQVVAIYQNCGRLDIGIKDFLRKNDGKAVLAKFEKQAAPVEATVAETLKLSETSVV